MFSNAQITPFSGAVIDGLRGMFVSLRGDGAFVVLATRTIVPVDAGTVFASRNNVIGAAIRRGSALLTGSAVSIAPLNLNPKATYVSPFDFVRFATVGDDVDEATKDALIGKICEFYGIES